MSLEIESADVIRLVQQFLKEHGLSRTLATLQEEAQVSLNTVDSLEGFTGDINAGKWDAVLAQCAHLSLPERKVADLYEQVVLEMLELHEADTARSILHHTKPMVLLKQREPQRYARLEHMLALPDFDTTDAWPAGTSKERRRAEIAESLAAEVSVVPPSRLLALLGQALKFQQHQGMLPPGARFDLFQGTAAKKRDEVEHYPDTLHRVIKFGKKSYAECALFTKDGQHLVTGSVDGFIEIWNFETGRIKKDLAFQAEDKFMMHRGPVLCLAASRNSELLASGCKDGSAKVWKLATGQCMRRFSKAHTQGITSIQFSRDSSQVITASFDGLIRIHGLKSGRQLKEFRGHTSYVNTVALSHDGARLVSASSDGTVRVWSVKTEECVHTFSPPSGRDVSVLSVAIVPGAGDQLVVCTRSKSVYLTNLQGQVIRTFATQESHSGDFVCAQLSPKGEWLYCAAEDNVLYCFSVTSGSMEHMMKVQDKEVVGVAHHPHRNLVGTCGLDGTLKLWTWRK